MFIETTPAEQAEGPVADAYRGATGQFGFLPNWALAFANRPEVLAAWGGLNLSIREGMDRRRYELATIAAARQLRSTYCAMAHSWMLTDRLNLLPAEDLQQILTDPQTATALSELDRAVMDFAQLVARDASAVSQDDVQRLRAHGLSDTDVLDVALAAAARCFFAKVLDAMGARADHQLGEALGPELTALLTVGRPAEVAQDEPADDVLPA
jgi:uncharacterized peroxidase-related enzyme